MEIKKKVLDNGLRVILAPFKETEAVSVFIVIGAGSRYEKKTENGIAHFLEHMFFKGGKKYKNTKEIANAIDSGGGEFNAFTGKEYVGYYVKIVRDKLDLACDVLGDMMSNARFPKEEIEKERGVILEEYNMYQDMPQYMVEWKFEELIFGDQAIGRDQLGTKDFISSVQRETFVNFKNKLYTPDNVVIAVSGNFDEKQAMENIEKKFIFKNNKEKKNYKKYENMDIKNKTLKIKKKTEQSHIVFGFKSLSLLDDDFMAEKMMGTVFGGNMSSRIFLSVREEKGYAYRIRSESQNYLDIGTFTTSAGLKNKSVKDAIKLIKEEHLKMKNDGITQEELEKAKSYYKGKLALSFEDSDDLAFLLARSELLEKKYKTPKMLYEEIKSVNIDDIKRVINKTIDLENFYLAYIGPESL